MKNRIYLYLVAIFCLIQTSASFAQTGSPDEQLAGQYFQNREFDKALVYYEKLFNKKNNPLYYHYYLQCLLEIKDFRKAEKVVKKQIKQYPEALNYLVDLGSVYKASEEEGKSKKEFERAIKALSPNYEQIATLAKSFISIKELDYAIEAYQKGSDLLKGTYPFNFELAEVYAHKGDLTSMINEYLNVLEISDSYIQSVQNALQSNFGSDVDNKKNTVLKTELLKRINRSPDKTIFAELLIWILIQQKEFDSAFIHTKALDKRRKEDGTRVMFLAKLAASNGDYDAATKAYQYVIDKGFDNYYYTNARIEQLQVSYTKVINQHQYTKNELLDLEAKYIKTLDDLGKSANTAPMIKNLASLQAFYLNKSNEAIKLLEEAINIPQISTTLQAECKLELGDILLMTGDIWEASLRYSQVEKAFKHDPIGQEAKFRNAKISYYSGDFKWAQAQLDVLKGATSKLISNDAMALSLLISDNTAIDTNTVPLAMFSRADLLFFQNKDSAANATLDSIHLQFPDHSLADDILFKRANVYLKRGKFEEASKLLEQIFTNFQYDILADDALFKLAELNETRFNNKDKAMELYQDLLLKFPGSLFTVEARKRYRTLRGDVIN